MIRDIKYSATAFLHNVTACLFFIGMIFVTACNHKIQREQIAEPIDPDQHDLSAWRNIKPGIYSGFGSIDVDYSKSIPPQGNIDQSIKLQGWKGERVNCLLLVWSSGTKEQIRIKASGFGSGSGEIAKEKTSVSIVRYILTDAFPGGNYREDKSKFPVHLKPDRISKGNTFIIDSPGTRPVWISVDIPADATAGIYTGTISRQSSSGTVIHKITLEVQNKRLPPPAEWSFHLDLWQNPFAVARYHHVKLWSKEHYQLLRPLLKKLADAGQKCITATLIDKPWGNDSTIGPCFDPYGSMIKWTRKKDKTWAYDYTVFDRYVSFAMECGIKKQINCYSMVPISNKFTWYDETTANTVVMEAFPGTAAYENIWKAFLIDFRSHLKEKGWLNITTIALDEREEDEMKKMFSFLKETAPEFKIAMAGFYYKDLNTSIYDFSSNWRHTGMVSGDVMASRKKSGLKTTYYVACMIPRPNNFTFSPPAESCFEGWYASAMGFDGFLRWAYNSWPEQPETDSRFSLFPSGDTYLVYPDAQSSVRFERIREGIQDYEKIRILREELAVDSSAKAVIARRKLNDFLNTINPKTLDNRSAADVINEGKNLLYNITRDVFDFQALLQNPTQKPFQKLTGLQNKTPNNAE